MKNRTTFYVDEEFLKQFKMICEREGESMSEKVESYIQQYVMAHTQGNPQMLLSSFGAEPQLTCFRCQKQFPQLIRVEYISGLTTQVCKGCLEKDKRRRVIKKVKGGA